MAISVPSKSDQFTQYTAAPQQMVKPTDWGANLRVSYGKITFTAAGSTTAATGDLKLIQMPAGRLRILPDLCRVICPVGTATADLDVGYGEHLDQDGATVEADYDAFVASADVGGGAIDAAFDAGVEVGLEFYSQDGFDIAASFDTADGPASGDLIVVVVYALGR